MTGMSTSPRQLRFSKLIAAVVLLFVVAGCNPDLINKTTYDGTRYVTECDTFKQEIDALIAANQGATTLRVAEYDNSGLGYYSLEPGQFEQIGDTLYFRLIDDLFWAKYLHESKGIGVQVMLSYTAQDHLYDIESEPQGQVSTLLVNEDYWIANREPYFLYKMPVQGLVDGKQLTLQFAVAKYKKDGTVKKYMCETDTLPLGPVDPSCCTDRPWESAQPKSVVMTPQLDINAEEYKYQGFTGTLDLIFPMMSTKFDKKQLNNVILNFIQKYKDAGYDVKDISITSYASQGGTVQLNQDLSERRSAAVAEDLMAAFAADSMGGGADVPVNATGRGEDWDRFDLLVKTAAFSEEEREQLLAISGNSMSLDEKEAELRKLRFWNKLVEEVLIYCRHAYIQFNFEYAGDAAVDAYYDGEITIISPELYNVATSTQEIGPYEPGVDVNENLGILNRLISSTDSPSDNLYAMRSSYHMANGDVRSAIADIERAQQAAPSNQEYTMAALAYKADNAYNMSMVDRMRLLNEYNDYVAREPGNTMLQMNRAVMMDRVGYISGALAEYDKMNANSAVYYNNRGVARLKTNRLTEAQADFEQAVSVDPNLPHAYFNMALVHAWRGLPNETVAALDRAIELLPALKNEVRSNAAFANLRSTPAFAKYR